MTGDLLVPTSFSLNKGNLDFFFPMLTALTHIEAQ